MHWLYLLVAFGALVVAFSSKYGIVLFLGVVAACVLMALWVRGMYLARVGTREDAAPLIIDPAELHRLREQAALRRAEADAAGAQAAYRGPLQAGPDATTIDAGGEFPQTVSATLGAAAAVPADFDEPAAALGAGPDTPGRRAVFAVPEDGVTLDFRNVDVAPPRGPSRP